MRILARETLVEEAFEATGPVFIVVPVQVVVAHLVHHNSHYQAGLTRFGGGGAGLGGKRRYEAQEQCCEENGFFHGKKFDVCTSLFYPIRQEHIRILTAPIEAVGGEHKFFAIGREHREPVEHFVESDLLEPGAVQIDGK